MCHKIKPNQTKPVNTFFLNLVFSLKNIQMYSGTYYLISYPSNYNSGNSIPVLINIALILLENVTLKTKVNEF